MPTPKMAVANGVRLGRDGWAQAKATLTRRLEGRPASYRLPAITMVHGSTTIFISSRSPFTFSHGRLYSKTKVLTPACVPANSNS